jgi:uncharacterized protein (TIGR03084 family)
MKQILSDLAWEQDTLDALVSGLDDAGWNQATYCLDWTIKDEICHLAFFDYTARLSATDPEAFNNHLMEDFGQIKSEEDVLVISLAKGQAMTVPELLDWWRSERKNMIDTMAPLDPKDRLPWYGPPMSARSFATARIMETWAHGQDVYDALRTKRPPSPGLKHIAHLGVTTFGWSFSNRRMDVPQTPVRVELTAPSGDVWTWGEASAEEKVQGPAEDFCLVVTRRRHVDDTALVTEGDAARQWMRLAQCFAGPPETGPEKGFMRNK